MTRLRYGIFKIFNSLMGRTMNRALPWGGGAFDGGGVDLHAAVGQKTPEAAAVVGLPPSCGIRRLRPIEIWGVLPVLAG